MRGVPSATPGAAVGLLIMLLLATPAATITAPDADPVPRPLGDDPDRKGLDAWLAWTEAAPLADLEARAPIDAERFGPTGIPAPDHLWGYNDLPTEDRRAAWRAWLHVSAWAAADGTGRYIEEQQDEPPANISQGSELGEPHGLGHLWSMENHGSPRALHAADADGGTFLVTSSGILKIASPGAVPDWMVKPQGWIGHTMATDADADGQRDVVIGTYAGFSSDAPSLVVVDGANGTVRFAGLEGDQMLVFWTLSDVDADGVDEVLGWDARGMMVAYRLDGSQVYEVELTQLPLPDAVSTPLLYLGLYAARENSHSFGFADVDGDGVQDLVVPEAIQGYLYGTGLGQLARATMPLVAAFSGVDGAEIWRVPVVDDPSARSYQHIMGSGDFDGDGRDDVLVRSTRFDFKPLITYREERYVVLSGEHGAVLSDDRGGWVRVCTLVCESQDLQGLPFWPVGFADLDRDGAAEMVGIAFEANEEQGFSLAVVGHVPPDLPGAPSEERYRYDVLTHDGGYDEAWNMQFRDVDGDGEVEFVLPIGTVNRTDDGGYTDYRTHLYIADAAGVRGGPTPQRVGLWDVDATGQAYAWTIDDDRWGPVDEDGHRMSDGFRLIISVYPRLFFDHDGDQVPDLLLKKTRGYMWVDGRTGQLLEDIVRPLDVWARGVYEERGRVVVFEENGATRSHELVDLATGNLLWSLEWSAVDDGHVGGLVDVDGDGHLDLMSLHFDGGDRFDDVVTSEAVGGGTTFRFRDMRADEVIWEGSWSSANVRTMDVLPKRPGEEILVRHRSDDSERLLSLYVVEDGGEPRWTHNIGSGTLREAVDGYLLIESRESDQVFEVLEASEGQVVTSHVLDAGTATTRVLFQRVDGDRFPDLVMSLIDEEQAGASWFVVHDWANEREAVRFPLVPHGPEGSFDDMNGDLGGSMEPEMEGASPSRVVRPVGDWDGDGRTDFAFHEADRAVVRATGSGEVLALAPGRGSPRYTVDLNGDGRDELGFLSDQGRLRFFNHRMGETLVGDDEEDGTRVIRNTEGPETDPEAADFFREEEKGLPAPMPLLFLLWLAGWIGRRRQRVRTGPVCG